ncbi:MAG: MATE family efflux transporter [Clostridia bacterium]|nr:MATE family efflux transporter [Clostridia bacterium]
MALSAKRIDIVNGPMIPNIIRFSLPLIATGMLQLLYNAADNIVVGQFDGQTALAAVGSTGSLINLIVNICMGLAVGSSVAVAQDYGAGNKDGVHQTIHTSVLVSMIGGLVVALVGFFFSGTFLRWMGSPENVLPLSTLYLKIYFLGTPASMIYNFCASMLRAVGDTKRPLYFLTISGLINVLLNLLFVIVFHMGVAGVALATIISQYVSMIMVLVYLHKLDDCCHLDFRKLKLYRNKMVKIIQVGIPAGLQGSVFSISNVVIQSSINSFGSVVMSGNTAAGQLEGFVYTAMNALYQAALTFTGQHVGAGNIHKLHRVMLSCAAIVLVIGLVMGIGMYAVGEPLLKIYLPIEANPATEEAMQTNMENLKAIEYGMVRLMYVMLPYFLCGMMEVMVGCQRGMGMSVTPMITSMLGACGIRIFWIYTFFTWYRSLPMLYISYPISWFITTAVHTLNYFRAHSKTKKLYQKEHPESAIA